MPGFGNVVLSFDRLSLRPLLKVGNYLSKWITECRVKTGLSSVSEWSHKCKASIVESGK